MSVVPRIRNLRLRRNLLLLLAKNESIPEQDLRAALRSEYPHHPPDVLDSAVDTALLELERAGMVQFATAGHISLTKAGRLEHKVIMDTQELRREKSESRHMLVRQLVRKKEITAQKKAESEKTHDMVEKQIGRLAHLLGRRWKPEHKLLKDGPKVDVVWYVPKNPSKISHAFEVQHRGDPKRAIANLHAIRQYPESLGCATFIVVWYAKEVSRLERHLGPGSGIKVLQASQIRRWLDVFESASSDQLVAQYLARLLKAYRNKDGLEVLKKRSPESRAPLIDVLHEIVQAGLVGNPIAL